MIFWYYDMSIKHIILGYISAVMLVDYFWDWIIWVKNVLDIRGLLFIKIGMKKHNMFLVYFWLVVYFWYLIGYINIRMYAVLIGPCCSWCYTFLFSSYDAWGKTGWIYKRMFFYHDFKLNKCIIFYSAKLWYCKIIITILFLNRSIFQTFVWFDVFLF